MQGDNEYREVVTIDETNIIEVKTTGAVESKLSKGCRRNSAGAGAFEFPGGAVPSKTCHFSGGGVAGAEGAGPETAGPGPGEGESAVFSGGEGESGGRKRRGVCAGEKTRPYGVSALVY